MLSNCDAVLISSPENMRYIAGFTGEGYVVISNNERYIFTDSRYSEKAEEETDGYIVSEGNVFEYLKKFDIVGVEEKHITFLVADKIKNKVYKSEFLDSMRMVKTPEEIEKIRIAEEIACRSFEKVLEYVSVGVRECDIAREFEYIMKKEGATGPAFETIVISGKKTSLPHGVPSDKKLEKGDLVTMDFGCLYEGYRSDVTRTFCMGKADEKQREIYEIVKEAQQVGLNTIKSGITGREADSVARKVIEDRGYGEYFRHALGHGVGLAIHELPNLSPRCEIVLKPGMVVTNEPGIYIPDFGGVRIEDTVVVTENGIENLCRLSKDLLEL